MDYRQLLIGAFLALCSSLAFAGFAQLSPPAGWAGSAGGYSMPSSANSATFNGGFSGPGGSMNIGGKAVTMPASYRFAANAGRFAASALFKNPAWFAASAVVGYLADQCLGVVNGQWSITCGGPPPADACLTAPCMEYRYDPGTWQWSRESACAAAMPGIAASYPSFNFVGSYVSGVTCFMRRTNKPSGTPASDLSMGNGISRSTAPYVPPPFSPVSIPEPDFIERISPKPIPADLPKVIPGPWPVIEPVINPTPGDNPKSRPMVVPDGLPRPVPNTDPQQWEQPGIRISPAPTPSAPWQVEIDPIKTPVPGPDASPEPYTPGEESPEPKPDETSDLCKLNPDIVACQKLGDAEAVAVPNDVRQMAITRNEGWGASNGTCPAARHLTVQGRDIPIPLDLVCQFASGIRPFVIGFAWLVAAMTFFGVVRKVG